jgi:hypothetical protein
LFVKSILEFVFPPIAAVDEVGSNLHFGPITAIRCADHEGPVRAYSVEKLRHAKIASEIWNAVPTIG